MQPDDLRRILRQNPDIELVDPRAIATAPPRTMRGSSEHALQAAVIAECERRAVTDERWRLIFAIPNGGQRHAAVAAKLRAEGVRAGVPDLFLACPCRGFAGAFLELKVGRNQPSAHQQGWISALSAQGYFVACIHDSVDRVVELIDWYLNP